MNKKKNTLLLSFTIFFTTTILTHVSIRNKSQKEFTNVSLTKYIKPFEEIYLSDVPLVGGKNASLGQMINELSNKNIRVPNGFAITVDAYWYYLQCNNLVRPIKELLNQISNPQDFVALKNISKQIRSHIERILRRKCFLRSRVM